MSVLAVVCDQRRGWEERTSMEQRKLYSEKKAAD